MVQRSKVVQKILTAWDLHSRLPVSSDVYAPQENKYVPHYWILCTSKLMSPCLIHHLLGLL
jgi:hypothetical protein